MGNDQIIIIGQGIAGSCLALELINRGHHPLVLDASLEFASTSAAGGLVHPLVFSKLRPTWMGEESYNHGESWYPRAEALLKTSFWYPLGIFRQLKPDQVETWHSQQSQPDQKSSLLGEIQYPKDLPRISPPSNQVATKNASNLGQLRGDLPLGRGRLGAWLDAKGFIEGVRRYLTICKLLVQERIEEKSIDYRARTIMIGGKRRPYTKLVFATGLQAQQGFGMPTFTPISALPFYGAKGTILDLYLPELHLPGAILGAASIIPLPPNQGAGLVRVGSTYHRDYQDCEPVDSDVSELCRRVSQMLDQTKETALSSQVTRQWTGIRPAARDRLPYLGQLSPQLGEGLYCFNGLGTRGLLTAPKLAAQLADSLLHSTPLPKELSPTRIGEGATNNP